MTVREISAIIAAKYVKVKQQAKMAFDVNNTSAIKPNSWVLLYFKKINRVDGHESYMGGVHFYTKENAEAGAPSAKHCVSALRHAEHFIGSKRQAQIRRLFLGFQDAGLCGSLVQAGPKEGLGAFACVRGTESDPRCRRRC